MFRVTIPGVALTLPLLWAKRHVTFQVAIHLGALAITELHHHETVPGARTICEMPLSVM